MRHFLLPAFEVAGFGRMELVLSTSMFLNLGYFAHRMCDFGGKKYIFACRMKKCNRMRGGITYILVVLLFVMVGMLSCQRISAQGFASLNKSTLVRHASSGDDVGRYCIHSCIVSEVVSEVQAPSTVLKVLSKNSEICGRSLPAFFAVHAFAHTAFVNLHPDPVDYYIFSLGKIRI